MSYRKERFLSFDSVVPVGQTNLFIDQSEGEIRKLFLKILNEGIHGFCFSLYEEGQKPGMVIGEDQIRRRMQILKPHSQWIRSFSCVEGNELIPKVAKEMGMNTMVGAWLGSDEGKNQIEIENLILLARAGLVDIAAVGNEVLYRDDLSEEQLLKYIEKVKKAIPNVPVGYVDAYYEFTMRPALTEICDVILSNCYPYWEGTDFNYSIQHMQQMYYQAFGAGRGKKVIITETGWPTKGTGLGSAIPSPLNAMIYFINTHYWAKRNNIDVFHFSSFDESWKVGAEGDVGAYWGIWDKSEKIKF